MQKTVNILLAAFILLFALPPSSEAQSYPPAWTSAGSYAVGDQVQLNGNVLRAIRAVTPGSFKYAYWELWEVRANTTILVGTGGQFPTLVTAWTYAINCRIAQGSTLTFKILSGHTENFSASFSLDHPFGARIAITGAGTSDSQVILNFSANVSGLQLDSGHVLGQLSNLIIQSTGTGVGVFVTGNAALSSLSNVEVGGFKTGIQTSFGGFVSMDAVAVAGPGASVSGSVGVLATDGGRVNIADNLVGAQGPVFVNNNETGIEAQSSGMIQADGGSNLSVENFDLAAVEAADHGTVVVDTPITVNGSKNFQNADSTGEFGFWSRTYGTIVANGCSATECGSAQFDADDGGFIEAENASADGTANGAVGASGGFMARYGGRIDAYGVAVANAQYGIIAEFNSSIDARSAVIQNASSVYDVYAGSSSYIEAQLLTDPTPGAKGWYCDGAVSANPSNSEVGGNGSIIQP